MSSVEGKLSTANRLFDREALLYVAGDFGELGMGRQGELASGTGRYGLFGGKVSPFSPAWADIGGHKYVMGAGFGRMDNTVTYKTPTFAGFNVLAQYSFKKDNESKEYKDNREGSSAVDRQYALAPPSRPATSTSPASSPRRTSSPSARRMLKIP